MSVDVIDRHKYERFYDKFYSRNDKDARAPLVIDYHIEHNISKNGFKDLWNYYYKLTKK